MFNRLVEHDAWIKSAVKDGLSVKIKKCTYSSVLHSHTILMNVCPCGRYRQLFNSVLYPNNHILKSSKIIFNGLVLFESR